MKDAQAYEWLDAHFERLNTKKRLHTAWWLPGQGVAVNLPMTGGLQLWRNSRGYQCPRLNSWGEIRR